MIQACSAAYCIAIAHLIKHPGQSEGAFSAASTWATTQPCQAVQEWLEQAQDITYKPSVEHRCGWMKWGFLYAFR